MNTITSSILLIVMLLLFPMAISFTNLTKQINFPNYVTLCIKYAFFISLIPLSSFFNSNTEVMITN